MNDDDRNSADVNQDVSDFLEGKLDDARLSRLSELLKTDPNAISTLVDAAIMHELLTCRYADQRSETAAVALLTSLGVPEEEGAASHLFASRTRSVGRRLVAIVWHPAANFPSSAAALAATVLIAAGLFWAF